MRHGHSDGEGKEADEHSRPNHPGSAKMHTQEV